MTSVHHLTQEEARRIAVRAQLLDADRPSDLLDVVRRLGFVQLEPTSAVAPTADVVLWTRLGSTYSLGELEDLVDEQQLVELRAMVRPPEDIALFRAEMAAWPGPGELTGWQQDVAQWVHDNNACREAILDLLRSDGPLPWSAFPDICVRPWRSTGWTNNKNVQRLVGFLVQRGEVASAGRQGRERLWDLAERIYPDDPEVPLDEALRIRDERSLQSLGIARRLDAGEPAVIDGVRGRWRVDPDQLDRPFEGRAALLSPLDRLVFDRRRTADLFGFDYQLEMYKPAASRRWGYWALPILHGDRLVGKLDATAERDRGILRVDAVHEDEPWSRTVRRDVDREVADLARWLDLELVRTG